MSTPILLIQCLDPGATKPTGNPCQPCVKPPPPSTGGYLSRPPDANGLYPGVCIAAYMWGITYAKGPLQIDYAEFIWGQELILIESVSAASPVITTTRTAGWDSPLVFQPPDIFYSIVQSYYCYCATQNCTYMLDQPIDTTSDPSGAAAYQATKGALEDSITQFLGYDPFVP